MKKIFAVALVSLVTINSAHAGFGGGFRGSSFSSFRSSGFSRSYSYRPSPSYTRPSPSFSRPAYVAPRPVVRQTVVNQTVVHQTVNHSTGGGGGFFSSMFGSMAGAGLVNWFMQPKQPDPAPVQQAQPAPVQVQQVPVNCADPVNRAIPVCVEWNKTKH